MNGFDEESQRTICSICGKPYLYPEEHICQERKTICSICDKPYLYPEEHNCYEESLRECDEDDGPS